MNDRITGSNMNPFAIPKSMIINHSRKKTMKIYDFEGETTTMAMKVENPPWNTLDPIVRRAI